ncbi:MAG TPA: phytase [Steroidobacteraceae bacterium]|nr:phytase [Steroidobacteraceae bacterium]
MHRSKFIAALLGTAWLASSHAAPDTAAGATAGRDVTVAPVLQTRPGAEDAANDVAFWLHPSAPERSLVLGAGGSAGLEVFGLDGRSRQRVAEIQADLVDVRYAVPLVGSMIDLVTVGDVRRGLLHFYAVDPGSGTLRPVPAPPVEVGAEMTGLCSYRSPITGRLYLLTATDDGDVVQWEVATRGESVVTRAIRRLPFGRGAGACVADDASQALYVAVETTGLWRVGAEPESDAAPRQLDALAPFGALDEEVKGLALYRADAGTAYLLAADVGAERLRVYDLDGARLGRVVLEAAGEIPAVAETEAFDLVAGSLPGFAGGALLVADEDNGDAYANYKLIPWSGLAEALGLARRAAAPERSATPPRAVTVEPTAETDPVTTYGDAADDPAIWVHPTDPAQSLVIGANKKLGLEVYDLTGRRLQTLPDGRMNNVDVRDGFPFTRGRAPIVAASNRTTKTIALYRIDAATRRLVPVELEASETGLRDPYGLCLYHSARDGRFYVFVNDADTGLMRQWRLDERRGKVRATAVRDVQVGSQAEGCVADDELGHLYVGEEDTGLWKYAADPRGGTARTAVDRTEGGHLTADVEGMSLWVGAEGKGYLVVSNQGEDNYAVYRREGDNAFVGKFHIVADARNIDGASETDGLDVVSAPLGEDFPRGLLVVQDGRNLTPSATQNFKLVSWDAIARALGLD